ncbi:MAG: HlyC/CorC family transporter [Sulfurospirillum sp.]|nr:HlyC/CorC family transporter [Sulfurospirillum sp.]
MSLLFVYLFLAVGVSFLCSILESVLLSINPSHVSIIKKDNPKAGLLLEKLKNEINISIAAILILNTIANTLGAAGVGAEASKIFGSDYVFYISVLLTLLILFVSEIIPKTIGAIYYKQLAPRIAYIIQFFIYITYPLIKVSLFVTKKISQGKKANKITREEFIQTMLLGEDDGVIDEMESDVIENLLSLDKSKIFDILTPRSVVFAIDANTKLKDIIEKDDIMRFSRIPVYEETIDNIIGIAFAKQIFQGAIYDKSMFVKELVHPVFSLHENIPVSYALEMFIKRKEHMFIVTDSYGQTEGIVTLEDCIETLLGLEIMDECDTTDDMQRLAKEKMKQRKKEKKIIKKITKQTP